MLNFFGGLTWQTKLIAIAALTIAGFTAGWTAHGWKTDAGLARTIAKVEKTRENDQEKGGQLVAATETKKGEVQYVYKTIYREIPHVKNANDICFNSDSLQLWNRAITAENSNRTESADPPGKIDTIAGPEETATVEQVLGNAVENFDKCTVNNINHNALLDRLEQLKGKMCYCSK